MDQGDWLVAEKGSLSPMAPKEALNSSMAAIEVAADRPTSLARTTQQAPGSPLLKVQPEGRPWQSVSAEMQPGIKAPARGQQGLWLLRTAPSSGRTRSEPGQDLHLANIQHIKRYNSCGNSPAFTHNIVIYSSPRQAMKDKEPTNNRILARSMAHELTTEELTEISGGGFTANTCTRCDVDGGCDPGMSMMAF